MTNDDDATVMSWPPPPNLDSDDPQAEVKKILYQAQVEEALARRRAAAEQRKTQAADDAEARKAAWVSEYTLRQAVQQAHLDVAKGAPERAQARAQFIQAAAAAIGTVYVAILALSYKAGDTNAKAQSLPVQGIIPTVYLGLAIVLAAVYLTYITAQSPAVGPEPGASLFENQARRLDAFADWIGGLVLPRIYFLHASVVSLAFAVGLLPFAYIQVDLPAIVGVGVGGALFVFTTPLIVRRWTKPST